MPAGRLVIVPAPLPVPAAVSRKPLGGGDVTPVVIAPTLLPLDSVNHIRLSGPAVMKSGVAPSVGIVNSSAAVITPSVVITPMWFVLPPISVNQIRPSGPAAMPNGWLLDVTAGKFVTVPSGVTRVIWLESWSA